MNNKHNNLKISKRSSSKYIQKIIEEISERYGIDIQADRNSASGFAYTRDGIIGDFSIYVSTAIREEGRFLSKLANNIDFLKCVCSLYHEEQHIIQNCRNYYDACPDENVILMSMRKLASSENRRYYTGLNRYRNDLSEIDAEMMALAYTYDFVKDNFPNADADALMCELVNEKIKISDYFITGKFKTFDDILDAFSDHYEEAKTRSVAYRVRELRPTQEINPKEDECIRFLQSCIRENEDNRPLIDKFNAATDPHEKDLMIASITHHLHPEIEYERIYPCLKNIDLSPEEIFDSRLPQPPEGLIKAISKEKIERRIQIANEIHSRIESQMYSGYVHSAENTDEKLNESLLNESHVQKEDEYEP